MLQFSLVASAALVRSRMLARSAALTGLLVLPIVALSASARAQNELGQRTPSVEVAAPTAATPVPTAPAPAAPAPAATAPAPAPAPAATARAPAATAPAATAPAATAPAPAAPTLSDGRETKVAGRAHEGFYLRLVSGPSFVSFSGHGPSGSASLTGTGAGGLIAIGGAIAPGFVLAGTIQGTALSAEFDGGPFAHATVSSQGRTRTASNRAAGGFGMIGMLVDWYPEPKAGWHVGLSSGVGALVLTNWADDSDLAGLNLTGSLFGGYDWTIGRNWGLGLQLTASGASSTKLLDENSRDTGYRLTPLSVGVQASLLYF